MKPARGNRVNDHLDQTKRRREGCRRKRRRHAPTQGLMVRQRHCRPDEPARPDDEEDRDRPEDRLRVTLRGAADKSRRRGSDGIGFSLADAAPVRWPVPFIRHKGSFNGIAQRRPVRHRGRGKLRHDGQTDRKNQGLFRRAGLRCRTRWAAAAGRDALHPERKE